MTLPTLYARTNTDAVQQWTVTIEGDKYCTTFGQVDGKLQTTNWTECFETNGGKANERNPQKQALFEAQALWKKKKDSGYFENIKDIDKATFVEPMLAKKFEDYEDSLTYPVVSERKLDAFEILQQKTECSAGMVKSSRAVLIFSKNSNTSLKNFQVQFWTESFIAINLTTTSIKFVRLLKKQSPLLQNSKKLQTQFNIGFMIGF
jgi:hypothetical protein